MQRLVFPLLILLSAVNAHATLPEGQSLFCAGPEGQSVSVARSDAADRTREAIFLKLAGADSTQMTRQRLVLDRHGVYKGVVSTSLLSRSGIRAGDVVILTPNSLSVGELSWPSLQCRWVVDQELGGGE